MPEENPPAPPPAATPIAEAEASLAELNGRVTAAETVLQQCRDAATAAQVEIDEAKAHQASPLEDRVLKLEDWIARARQSAPTLPPL